MGIFGGCYYCSAVDEEGFIHIITEQNAKATESTNIAKLPEGEIPIYVAFQSNFIIALSKSGNVYQYDLSSDFTGKLSPVLELVGIQRTSISGTTNHCLAVSVDGQVFGRDKHHSEKNFYVDEYDDNESDKNIDANEDDKDNVINDHDDNENNQNDHDDNENNQNDDDDDDNEADKIDEDYDHLIFCI